MKINIAVDGTAGSGKTTILKEVAKKINYQFIDTGLMYRAFTLHCINKNVNFNDEKEIIKNLDDFNIMINENKISLNNKNITDLLFDKDILKFLSLISNIKRIREWMVDKQRVLTESKGFVVVGRDITSVVLPNAELKIYVDCDPLIRAKRRKLQNESTNIFMSEKELYNSIIKRDKNDMSRKIGPLIKTEDSWYIDTSSKNIDEIIKDIVNKIKTITNKGT